MADAKNTKKHKSGEIIKGDFGNYNNHPISFGKFLEMSVDMNLILIVLFLIAFGLLMVYSASSFVAMRDWGNSAYYFRKQVISDLLGIFAMVVATFIPLKKLEGLRFWFLGIAVMVIFLVYPFGIESHGARRWIQVPVIGGSLQPAEVTKLFMILYLAAMINTLGNDVITSWLGFIICVVSSAIVSLLIYKITDNLSSALIVFLIAYIMCFVASADYKKYILLAFLGLGIAGGVVAYVASTDGAAEGSFRLTRVAAWIHPENSTETSAHQMLQGLYAIGNGGWFGKGLGQSAQKISVLPEPHNDMIFAVLCEELGIVGAIALMIMFALMIYRMFLIARNTKDRFSFLIVCGVMAHFAIQIILNIAVVTGSIPNTGVSLPFISYGGSSALFLLIEVGLVLNVDKANKAERRSA